MTKVTILTVVRNRPQLLLETIRCVQKQTYSNWEYIIVDDASDDETPQVIRQCIKDDKRICLIRRSTQGGPFLAANDGLKASTGRYVFNIDSDDISPPHRIQVQLEFLKQHPDLRACISPWWSFNEMGLIPGGKSHIPLRPRILRWALILSSFASHSSLCVERSALHEIGNYLSLSTGSDYALMCALSRQNWLGVVPEVLSYVRRHEGRMSKSVGRSDDGYEIGKSILRKHIAVGLGEDVDQDVFDGLVDINTLSSHHEIFQGINAVRSLRELILSDSTLDKKDVQEVINFSYYRQFQFLFSSLKAYPRNVIWSMVLLILSDPKAVFQLASFTNNIFQGQLKRFEFAYRPLGIL